MNTTKHTGKNGKRLVSLDIPKGKISPMMLRKILYAESIWYHSLEYSSFVPITLTTKQQKQSFTTLEEFIKGIKDCFAAYVNDVYCSYIAFFNSSLSHQYPQKIYLKFLLPMALDSSAQPTLCFLQVSPKFSKKQLLGCYFILVPLKEYSHEPFYFTTLADGVITRKMKHRFSLFHLPKMNLTARQEELFYHLLNDASEEIIRQKMKLTISGYRKLCIHITIEMNWFFGYVFTDVHEAVAYYKACFIHHDYQL